MGTISRNLATARMCRAGARLRAVGSGSQVLTVHLTQAIVILTADDGFPVCCGKVCRQRLAAPTDGANDQCCPFHADP